MLAAILLTATMHTVSVDTAAEPEALAGAEEDTRADWRAVAAPALSAAPWLVTTMAAASVTSALCGWSLGSCAAVAWRAPAYTLPGVLVLYFLTPVALGAAIFLVAVHPIISAVVSAPWSVIASPQRSVALRGAVAGALVSGLSIPVGVVLMGSLVMLAFVVSYTWYLRPPLQAPTSGRWDTPTAVMFLLFTVMTMLGVWIIGTMPGVASVLAMSAASLFEARRRSTREQSSTSRPYESTELAE